MKRYIVMVSFLVCVCAMLSGCGLWMDGSYVSVTPHQDQNYGAEKEIIEVSTYMQMRNALAEFVENGSESGIISVSSFGDAPLGFYMDAAIQYVMEHDPVCAYAVRDIAYEVGTDSGTETIVLEISYEHGRSEILRIRQVSGMEEAKEKIKDVLNNCDSSVVLQIQEYEQLDVVEFVQDYASENPDIVMEFPTVNTAVYPESGKERIVEIVFTYQSSRESLRQMQESVSPVFIAAGLYVKENEQIREKYAQLYSFLMTRFDYTVESSITPAYSLLYHGVGDEKAFANVYAAMCRSAGLECHVITGTRNGEPWTWNLIHFRGNYYHLDLLQSRQTGGFSPYIKSAMGDYMWDHSAYPG